MPKEIIKPGTWWTIQLRWQGSMKVAFVLRIQNGRRAGRRGSEHSWVRVHRHRKDPIRRARRVWKLMTPMQWAGSGYKFDDLKDALHTSKGRTIQNEVDNHKVIVEIVQVEGCLHYGTVSSRTVIERRFPPDLNAMEVIAYEHHLGENAGNLARCLTRVG